MESCDSSPSFMRATTSFDAKKDNSSQGGSECDDIVSISSSTCGSAINGPFAPKLSNSGIKLRTDNKKTPKNLGSIKSFRRRTKSRMIQSPVEISDDSLVDSSGGSPNYLKATSCSKGKKTNSQSPFGKSSSSQTISSKKSSVRNVRILIRTTSFKPKRGSLNYSRVHEDDASVDRATYSSTLKDSKFPEHVELHSRGKESEKDSGMKVCRYHHCSLHGHCHEAHDEPVPPLKRFLYKKRRSLKKQKSVTPRTESRLETKLSSEKKKNLKKKSQIISIVEPSNSGVENEESYGEQENAQFGDGCEPYDYSQDLGLFEVAFGESSFPERSYQDNLNISRKYEQDFGGYCLRCREQTIASNLGNGYKNEIPDKGYTDISDKSSSALFEKPKEYLENEASKKDSPKTPVIFDEVTKTKSVSLSGSDSQASTDSNSEEGELKDESTPTEDSKVDEVTEDKDSETNSPTQEVGKLQFSKKRHVSMWNLIHQHMSSNLAVESTNNAEENSVSSRDLPVSDMGVEKNESENQEIEVRKLFAIKLVREAIEKILLPEVQDQTSDSQSVTSENSPRPELIEKNQSEACTKENSEKSDAADKEEENASSKPKDESHITEDASSCPETIKETEKKNVSKTWKKAAPKHWSNLKKWILLQRFIRELEKVRKFNPKKPQLLPLNPDPEAEKVNLRPQTVDERKKSEEWMLDYALRQAVGQLAPTQKRKVGLLIKAFETVVPTQESPRVAFRIPGLMERAMMDSGDNKVSILESGNQENGKKLTEKNVSLDDSSDGNRVSILESEKQENGNKLTKKNASLDDSSDGSGKSVEKFVSSSVIYKNASKEENPRDKDTKEEQEEGTSRKNRVKMWHMIYQHVVSGIAEKVGSQLLDGSDNDMSDSIDESGNPNVGFTKSDALNLVKEAVDEILLPEIQEESISETNLNEIGDCKKYKPTKSKNWSKLKKLILLKRSIKALEKARKIEPKLISSLPQMSMSGSEEKEKIELRRQMMDEKKKAEQWMLDYAVQHIVTKLTPARKRRVFMLVEAFEAVVPLPEV